MHSLKGGRKEFPSTYPNKFVVQSLTDQPRLVYSVFWQQKQTKVPPIEFFYGRRWLETLFNRWLILDLPLECYPFWISWRAVLSNYLSSQWFEEIEKREMLTGANAIYHLLRHLQPQQVLEQIIDKWRFIAQYGLGQPANDPTTGFTESTTPLLQFIHVVMQSKMNAVIKRYTLIEHLLIQQRNPVWIVLFNLPVIPPDLRPIMKLQNGQIVISDLNELYRTLLTRNIAVSQLSFHQPTAMIQKGLLQRAVDNLFGHGNMLSDQASDKRSVQFKSLADIFSGKEGRIRENLLGKRVDYSGRSVIVVGPNLHLYQCGLPREMAVELFQPFIIYYLLYAKLVRSPQAAKFILRRRAPMIWPIVQTVVENHSIILNRAPTLHRLGIQSFQPILVSDKAIQLHPLVCAGFNADFDGDQMAVHVPLSLEAQAESSMLMSPYFNLLSPATSEAVTVPSQDMLLGIYLLSLKTKVGVYTKTTVQSQDTSMTCYTSTDVFALHSKYTHDERTIWLACSSKMKINTRLQIEQPVELQYSLYGYAMYIYQYSRFTITDRGTLLSRYLRTTLGRLLLNQHIEQSMRKTAKFYQQNQRQRRCSSV